MRPDDIMSKKFLGNITKSIFAFLLILSITGNAFAEAGPPIPLPKMSIIKAIEIATDYFHEKWRDSFKRANTRIEDFIITSVEWTNFFHNAYQKEWVWKITFVHPIQNDHKATYEITDRGDIIEEVMTK